MLNAGRALIVVAAFLVLGNASFGGQTGQVVFTSDPWPPFTIGREGEAAQGGISIALCKEIASRLGLEFSSTLHPWLRAMAYLKTGEADLTFPIIRNEERSRFLVFTDIVMTDKGRVWYLGKGQGRTIEWERVEDLRAYRVGIVSGYSHGNLFEAAFENKILETEPCKSYEQAIAKLLCRRMDILLGNESVISNLLASSPSWKGKLIHTPKPYNENVYRIGISKQSAVSKRLPEINRIIRKMKSDGSLDRLLKN